MNPGRYARLKEIVLTAASLADADRRAYLDGACAGEATLRAEAEGLLAGRGRTAGAMRTGAFDDVVARALDAARPARLPERIGPYRILGLLGEGGMGSVYRAQQDEPIRRSVALKVIRGGDSGAILARFESERQTLARMDHPNIATLLDAGSTPDGRPWFVMELVEGAPITSFARGAQLDTTARIHLFHDVCRAVRHAHRKGIIHRDLKPSNVLVAIAGDQPVPKVIDFSIARALGESLVDTEYRTRTGQIVGTLEYMSPEQARGETHRVDTRSDVYALGVILYELLTDRLPHDVRDQPLHEAVRHIVEEPPASLRRATTMASRRVDPDLDTLVRKCLEKDPDRRYGSAAELCDDLERYLSSRPILARPPSTFYVLRKLVARHRLAFGAAAAVTAALAVGLAGTSAGLVRASRARAAAEASAAQAKEEAAIADALNQFFVQDLLTAPAPTSLGINVSMREVLTAAVEKIEGKFADRPRVEAELRKSIGWVYGQLAEPALAAPQLARALELFKKTVGPDDPETQDAMTRLAGFLHEQGRFNEAAALHEDLLRRRRRMLGDDNRLTIQTMSNLGSNYMGMGRYAEAEPLLTQAVEGRRRILGPHHAGTYHSMTTLAAIYYGLARREESERLLKESLDGIKDHLGPDHAEVCLPASNLALLYLETDRPRDGLRVIEGALDSCRHAWGDVHPYVASAYETASRIWLALGAWDHGRARLDELLEAVTAKAGPESLQAASIVWLMGRMEAARGRPRKGDIYLRRALAMREKSGTIAAPEMKFWNACETCVRGDKPAALTLLQSAVETGYADPDRIEDAPELERVRTDPQFEQILALARTNRSSA